MQKILIVEDDESIVEVIKIILEENGYETLGISDGKSVFEKIKTEKFDLILLDMLLPGIGGDEICRQLKNGLLTKNIPIILLSASVQLPTKWKELGADAYVSKPFDIDELLTEIKRVLNKHQEFNDQL